ncbi:MAG: 4a-hydroxytetrahydrobiopterin dehydratase [Chloroflexi bacterium]|nr:MAG: 4a-hydroxytetrahydrobiopterin dehydratase [Chloroflexota bacterium]MBL1196829.1 4a-hydroxytetrahydrobiopterin dehydratase [Chloroflexota bacterium]NOH14124.1 4a-hydroxytetrahydrobiopterin dehydratase [Chloroflexota bacterium]
MEQRQEFLPQITEWQVVTEDDIERLERAYKLKNFVAALEFANRVGELAEEANHHPAILVEWGKVTVQWWTHVVGGLHPNDFIAAARTDVLYSP